MNRKQEPYEPEYYSHVYKKILGNKAAMASFDYRAKMVANFVKGESVLDVGCGIALIQKFIRKPVHYVGLDFSEFAIKHCRKVHDPRNTRFILTDVSARGFHIGLFPNGNEPPQFDTIIFSEILEHLSNPREVLEKYLFFNPARVIVTLPVAMPHEVSHIWPNWSTQDIENLFDGLGTITTEIYDKTWWLIILENIVKKESE